MMQNSLEDHFSRISSAVATQLLAFGHAAAVSSCPAQAMFVPLNLERESDLAPAMQNAFPNQGEVSVARELLHDEAVTSSALPSNIVADALATSDELQEGMLGGCCKGGSVWTSTRSTNPGSSDSSGSQ